MDPQTLDKVRCSLAAEALRSRGALKLRATGVSMLPTLWPGDLLTVQCLRAEEAEPGEIVLYMRSDRFFVHRIVSQNLSQDNASLITRGDCMPADDPPIGRNELLGKVTEIQRSDSVFLPARQAFAHAPASGLYVLSLESVSVRRTPALELPLP